MESTTNPIPSSSDDEIDLAELLRQLWSGRKIIIITTIIFLVIGIGYSYYKSLQMVKEYQSQVTLFVESPSPDSLLKIFSYPPFFTEVLQLELTGLYPDESLSVEEVLENQTPPQGTVASLMNRVTALKGDATTLIITVQMQDMNAATQLADSVVQKLTQYLNAAQKIRVEQTQQILKEDSVKNIQLLLDNSSRNLKHLKQESSVNLHSLNDACIQAESNYLRARQTLSEFYALNALSLESIDSLEVNMLNADINLKHTIYCGLYQQLEQAKLSAKNQLEQARLDAAKQIDQATIDAAKKIEQLNLDAGKQQPVITILEPATGASQVNVPNPFKIPLIMLFFGLIAGTGIVFGKKFYITNFSENPGKDNAE